MVAQQSGKLRQEDWKLEPLQQFNYLVRPYTKKEGKRDRHRGIDLKFQHSGGLRHEDCPEFQASLNYSTRPHLKKILGGTKFNRKKKGTKPCMAHHTSNPSYQGG